MAPGGAMDASPGNPPALCRFPTLHGPVERTRRLVQRLPVHRAAPCLHRRQPVAADVHGQRQRARQPTAPVGWIHDVAASACIARSR